MKKFACGLIICSIVAGCAIHHKAVVATTDTHSKTDTVKQQASPIPITLGTVSHRYGTCTVVITNIIRQGDTVMLIPVKGLDSFDVDGLKISFNYRRLMIKNPPGCQVGITSLLYNVKKQ